MPVFLRFDWAPLLVTNDMKYGVWQKRSLRLTERGQWIADVLLQVTQKVTRGKSQEAGPQHIPEIRGDRSDIAQHKCMQIQCDRHATSRVHSEHDEIPRTL